MFTIPKYDVGGDIIEQDIQLMAQGGQYNDYTVTGFAVNGMLAIPVETPGNEGVVYITRDNAKLFFGLVEPK